MSIKEFIKKLASSPTESPTFFQIKSDNVDVKEDVTGTLQPDVHYFTIRVNQMFLTEDRKWFNEYEPMVVTLSEFVYNAAPVEHPFIVGRASLEGKMQNIPKGMVFSNTRVAGVHPFRGGRIATSIVLCQSKTDDYLRKTIQFVEQVSSILSKNLSKVASVYTEGAKAVLDGVDALLDSKNVQPLFGYRKEFDLDANDKVMPGYFVMLDRSDRKWDEKMFFVIKNQLFYGTDMASASAFNEINYVLFSITRSTERSDHELLPFYKTFQSIQTFAGNFYKISEDDKEKVREKLHALNVEMQSSPDLTEKQAITLLDNYVAKIQKIVTPKATILSGNADVVNETAWDIMRHKISAI